MIGRLWLAMFVLWEVVVVGYFLYALVTYGTQKEVFLVPALGMLAGGIVYRIGTWIARGS